MKKIIYAFILSILFAFLIPVKAQAEEPYRYIIDESESNYLTSEELSIIDEYLIQANSKESYDLYFYFVKDINKRDVLLDEYSYLENNKVVSKEKIYSNERRYKTKIWSWKRIK